MEERKRCVLHTKYTKLRSVRDLRASFLSFFQFGNNIKNKELRRARSETIKMLIHKFAKIKNKIETQ